MRKLDFTKATLGQLYEIAKHDPCSGLYALEARAEIERRAHAERSRTGRKIQQNIRTVAARW